MVCGLYLDSCRHLAGGVEQALELAMARERSELAREQLGLCLENAEIARVGPLPLCQDTGMALVFIDIGEDAHIDGNLNAAVDEGIRMAVERGYLRASMRSLPDGGNTGDNTPALTHIRVVSGDKVTLTVAPKGAGSENKSAFKALTPAEGLETAGRFVTDTVRAAGGAPCPPVIIGVGIGGAMEDAALLSKRALLRRVGEPSGNEVLAAFEAQSLAAINALGIGAQGFGGDITALAVHALAMPTHIASLPVAVTISCHCLRHSSETL